MRKWKVKLPGGHVFELESDDPGRALLERGHTSFALEQLHAAQLVGQSSKELIMRAFGRQGYKVLDIGRAERREATLRLDGLFWEADELC